MGANSTFLTMLVFTVVFGRIANLPTVATRRTHSWYFAGILPWTFFSSG